MNTAFTIQLPPKPGNLMVQLATFVRVPTVMYQNFADMAWVRYDKDKLKAEIFQQLQDWVKEQFPGLNIQAFEDYNIDEAEVARQKTGYPFTWGMWLLLGTGEGMEMAEPITAYLPSPTKRLE